MNRVVVTMISTSAYSDPSGLDYNPIAHSIVTSDDAAGMIHEIDIAAWQPISTLAVKTLAGDADGLGVNTGGIGVNTGATLLGAVDSGPTTPGCRTR